MKYIEGIHFRKNKSDELKLKINKKYIWSIPEELERKDIVKGDIVLAECKNTKAPIIVLNVFESDQENMKYKKIIKILDKNKK